MSTYTPILYTTLASASTSIFLSNIPQNYTDLVIVLNGTTNDPGTNNLRLQFNSDGAANYSATRLLGSGSAASSARSTSNTYAMVGDIASSLFTSIIQINSYANPQMYKTVLSRTGNSTAYLGAYSAIWRSTNAINTINLATNPALTFMSGTTIAVYGIESGTPKAQGGNIVTTDGTYWYHVFTGSGTFTPNQAITADYLVVAGGGGGPGYAYPGGGGAGGLRSTVGTTGGGGSLESALSLSANTKYSVIVGAGGAYGTGEPSIQPAFNGSNSSFHTVTSIGGGRGGGGWGTVNAVGGNGGSGGGGRAINSSTVNTYGTGTTNQGYRGGSAATDDVNYSNGGGGGGAGGVGANATSGAAGNGGTGVQISALATATNTGVSGYYAGGGGGGGTGSEGSGGAGGGGAASESGGTAGTVNTGSGGGGGGGSSAGATGGAGGSGIVIVRYSV